MADCALLPIVHSSAEEIAAYLLERLRAALAAEVSGRERARDRGRRGGGARTDGVVRGDALSRTGVPALGVLLVGLVLAGAGCGASLPDPESPGAHVLVAALRRLPSRLRAGEA